MRRLHSDSALAVMDPREDVPAPSNTPAPRGGRKPLFLRWLCLTVVVLAGLLLRAHNLGGIYLWLDETDFFNEAVYQDPPQPLVEFAFDRRDKTTNTVGWPAVVWLFSRTFGNTVSAARSASVAAGTAAIAAIFLVVFWSVRGAAVSPFVPAFLAAAFAAISMPLMEFSQRTYAYGGVPLFSALMILGHLRMTQTLALRPLSLPRLSVSLIPYTLIAALVLFMHSSLALLVFASITLLGLELFKIIRRGSRDERLVLSALGSLSALGILLAALANFKNPKFGYRIYLPDFYHSFDAGAFTFLLGRAYDLLTYHLNLFYNPDLYSPLRFNPFLLPLVLICVLGWVLAASGRSGPGARQLARLAALSMMLIALLSLLRVFPFGGVRQTLFLAPFSLAFVAFGLYSFRFQLAQRLAAAVLLAGYLGLWAYNLPRFYEDRTVQFVGGEIAQVWQVEHQLPIYTTHGSGATFRYMLRDYPNIPITDFEGFPDSSFLLASMNWPIEKDRWNPEFVSQMKKRGYTTTLLLERPAQHLQSLEHPTSLYFPPNGLWLYRIQEAKSISDDRTAGT